VQDCNDIAPTSEALQLFYALYHEALDDVRLDEWSGFFTQDCLYQVIARENWDAGLRLCFMQAEGKGMIIDRVQGILRTQQFGPRTYRRFFSGLRMTGTESTDILVRQNVLLVQTLMDQPSLILLCGVAYDRLVRADDRLLFKQRIVVADSELIENSLIYPL